VFTLAGLFSLDAFGGGLVVQSILALWVFQRFELSLESAGSIFFWTGRLFGRVLSRGGSAGGAIRAYWHDGFYARAVESAAAPDAVHAEPPAGDPVSAVA